MADCLADSLYNTFQLRTSYLDSSEGNVDIIVFHGATDAPKVDVLAGDSRVIEGLSYGSHSEYLSVPAGPYVLGVVR